MTEIKHTDSFTLKSTIKTKGVSVLKMKINQDIFYPKDTLKLDIEIDNKSTTEPTEALAARLIRRIEITDIKKNKPVVSHDYVIIEKEFGT